jgi:hypothetical protein
MTMSIDRSNYESWIVDWFDGNLDESQITSLMAFLDQNPDLKEELADLELFCLNPGPVRFMGKKSLRRNPDEMTESQFEYLCAAELENDLSPEQKAELRLIIESDPERRKTYMLISRSKLKPAGNTYPHKNKLLKRTPVQVVFRIAATSLSAAAVVIFAVMLFKPHPGTYSGNVATTETFNVMLSAPEKKNVVIAPTIKNRAASINKLIASLTPKSEVISNPDLPVRKDSSFHPEPILISKADAIQITGFNIPVPNDLIAMYVPEPVPVTAFPYTDPDADRSKIGKFIARTFREKLLKEKSPKDSPLKAYEIAEAGVAGLNKLFGWEMALKEKADETGNIQSVYFSSKLLKFNAAVNKNESAR